MGNLLFSPSGRISPAAFMRGALVLIALSAAFALVNVVSTSLGTLLGFVGLVFIYCWVVLFIKRYHEGGQSGWMSFIPIIAYVVLSTIATVLVLGGGIMDAFSAGLEAAQSGESSAEQNAAIEEAMTAGMGSMFYIKSAIVGALVSFAIAFGFNKIIPVDSGDNQYGPAGSGHIT